MNKLIGFLLGAALPLSAQALNFEYPYLYKDPRALGMGGASVAVGGSAAAVFSNPAGLSNIDRNAGFEVDLLPLNLSTNDNVKGFLDDMNNATDSSKYPTQTQQNQAVNDVLTKYTGKNLHGNLQTFPSLSRKGEKLGVAVGVLGAIKFDARTHQGFGTEGVLEADVNVTRGLVLGTSWDLDESLALGASFKALTRTGVQHSFTPRELVEQSGSGAMDKYITDTLKKEGSAKAIDLGAIYRPFKDKYWRPAFGVSLMSLGGLDFAGLGNLPATVNVGIAVQPEVRFLSQVTLAADLVDVTRQFEQDKDMRKRLRLGTEVRIWENTLSGLALRAGLYQGKPTMGADLRLTVIRVAYTTYTEQLGAISGQDSDRRHMLTLVIGW